MAVVISPAIKNVGAVLNVVGEIIQIVQAVEANKEDCQALANRVQCIQNAMQSFENLEKTFEALGNLHSTLTKIKDFVNKFKTAKCFKLIWDRNTGEVLLIPFRSTNVPQDKKAFAEFHVELDRRVQELGIEMNLSIIAHLSRGTDASQREQSSTQGGRDDATVEDDSIRRDNEIHV